jgi:hypothetical protein
MRLGWVVLALLLCVAPGVSGLGLSYQYLENRTLTLTPGENYYFKLTIQNDAAEEATVNVTLSSPIAQLVGGGVVTIPATTYDRFVYFNITVPSNATPGTRYPVSFTVSPAGPRGPGQVPFAVSYDRRIDVLVTTPPLVIPPSAAPPPDLSKVQRPEPDRLLVTLIAAVLLVLLCVLIVWLLRRRRPRKVRFTLRPTPRPEPRPDSPALRRAPEEQRFFLPDGRGIATLQELLDALRAMDDEAFRRHVNVHKNDFSRWVEEALGLPKLAHRMAKRRKRKELIRVLEHALR